MKDYESLRGWQLIWWLFKLFGLPITVPWLLYHFFILTQRRAKSVLIGQVVVITGASSGLGKALAQEFYNCGCKLILISRRKEKLEEVKNALLDLHNTVPTYPPVVLPSDITDINSLPQLIDKVLELYGKVDILINNAGISYRGKVVTTNVDVDMQVMLTNYFAQIALAKAVLPSMIKQKFGHIVCINSVQGKIAIPYRSAYTASKHALQAWCDSCRAEVAHQNIKITSICPGYINTDLSLNALTGSGSTYGMMDETTAKGYSSKYVAEKTLQAVLQQEKDLVISPTTPKIAIILRTVCPSLYFWIMQRRAKNDLEA